LQFSKRQPFRCDQRRGSASIDSVDVDFGLCDFLLAYQRSGNGKVQAARWQAPSGPKCQQIGIVRSPTNE
jgi:hypothetical protein